jgi:hypothetical protein
VTLDEQAADDQARQAADDSNRKQDMQDTSYAIGPLWAAIRAELRDYRAARAARRELRRELASATSPGDFAELDAILDRYDEHETSDIRHILNERRPGMQPQVVPALTGTWAAGA